MYIREQAANGSKENRISRIAAKLRQDMKDAGENPLQPQKNILRILPRRSRDPVHPVSFCEVKILLI
jgi:hypothetical protein